MLHKEQNYKLKVEIDGLNERNSMLKDQIMVFRDRITELEKETIIQSKENYILNSELDYENARNLQLKNRQESLVTGLQSSKVFDAKARDKVILEYEKKIEAIEEKLALYQRTDVGKDKL